MIYVSQLIQGKSWLDVNKCEKLPLNLGTPKRRSAWEIDGEPLFFLVTCDCRGFYYFCIGLFFGETFGKSKEKGWKKTILEKKNPFFLGVHVFFLFIQCHFFGIRWENKRLISWLFVLSRDWKNKIHKTT